MGLGMATESSGVPLESLSCSPGLSEEEEGGVEPSCASSLFERGILVSLRQGVSQAAVHIEMNIEKISSLNTQVTAGLKFFERSLTSLSVFWS